MIYNELIGIGITEVLMDLISCHGSTNKKSSRKFIMPYLVVEYYLAKGFVIIQQNYNNFGSAHNEEK